MERINRYSDYTKTNEEFLGKLIGAIYKKVKARINKTKGGNEVEVIYQKYLKMINDQFAKQAQVNLNIAAAAEQAAKESKVINWNRFNIINEADANAKLAADTLKNKKAVLDSIIKKLKDMALKEMDAILKKYGGATANPQLAIIINAKKDQFDLDYLNAQVNYLEAAGDKTMIANVIKQRDLISKKIEADYKNFDSVKAVKLKEGDNVIYLLKDKTKEDWDKLSDEQKKKPEEKPTSDIVGVHKIEKIEGDNYTLLDSEGKPTIIKNSAEIIGLAPVSNDETSGEYKVGDNVIYLKTDKTKEEWNALSDEEKKTPTEGKAVDIVGVHKIEKIDGENITMKDNEGKDFTKTKAEIVGISKEEEQNPAEEAKDALGEIKDDPEKMKRVANYAEFLKNARPEDIEAIEDLINGK